jgi:hypothetical protein
MCVVPIVHIHKLSIDALRVPPALRFATTRRSFDISRWRKASSFP